MKTKFLITALLMSLSSVALADHSAAVDVDVAVDSDLSLRQRDPNLAQPRWVPLSSMTTARRRTVIRVGEDRDRLQAIRLMNGNGSVYVYSINLVYDDGHRDTIAVNKWLYWRDPQMKFELAPEHELASLTIKTWSNGRSTFQVLGQRARRGGMRPPGFEPRPPPTPPAYLVANNLTFANTGYLNVPVGSDKGRFSALRVSSSASDTFIGHIHVTFESGAHQTININRMMYRGEVLTLDLDGGQQAITAMMLMQSHDGAARGAGRFSIELVR